MGRIHNLGISRSRAASYLSKVEVLLIPPAILLAPALMLTIIKLKPILDDGIHDSDIPVASALAEEPKKVRDKRRVKYAPQENVKEQIIHECIKHAENSFSKFANTITFGSKYESLYLNVRQLQCVFFNMRDGLEPGDISLCSSNRYTSLNFENRNAIMKLRNRNLKDPESLKGYLKLLRQFLPSLRDISKDYENVDVRNIVNNVYQDLKSYRKDIRKIVKAYKRCHLQPTASVPESVILKYNHKIISKFFKKEERAAAVFKQMNTVFTSLKIDAERRRKCLN